MIRVDPFHSFMPWSGKATEASPILLLTMPNQSPIDAIRLPKEAQKRPERAVGSLPFMPLSLFPGVVDHPKSRPLKEWPPRAPRKRS